MSQRATAFKYMITALSPMLLGFAILHALDPLTAGLRDDRREMYVPRASGIAGTKFNYLADHKDEYTGIFIGSSSLYMGIDPSVVDRRLSEAGLQEKTYNFGVPRESIMPRYELLESVLALHPRNLRWVVLDLTGASYEYAILPDAIDLYWLHLDESEWLLRSTLGLDVPARSKVHSLLWAGSLVLKSFAAPGNTALWMRQMLAWSRGYREAFELPTGYRPRDGQMPTFSQSEYLAGLSTGLKRMPSFSPVAMALVSHIASLARENGIQVVFFVPPLTFFGVPLQLDASLHPLIRFDDPGKYPGLYAFQNHWNDNHLNTTGATILSRLLADALVPILTQNASRTLSGK